MMYCPKCGKENEDNATYCQNCGTQIKTINKTGISKYIHLKPIIIGAVAFFVLLVLALVGIYISGSTNVPNSIFGTWSGLITLYVFLMIITGIITGFFSGKEYFSGIINSMIIAFFYSIIVGIVSHTLDSFFGALILFGVLGIIGGLVGVLTYRKYNNYNLMQ